MKKSSILCLLAAVIMVCPRLSAQVPTLVVWHNDGTSTDVELSTLPCVTFENDNVIIHSEVLHLEMEAKDVLRFSYKGMGTTKVEDIRQKAKYIWKDGLLIIQDTAPSSVTLYRVDGVQLPVNVCHHGNDVAVNLTALPKGSYLLYLNGMTIKFFR